MPRRPETTRSWSAAYSGTNGSGQQLSIASVPATIAASSTTRVPLTLNGTVAKVSANLGSSSVPVGSPAKVAVNVVAYDASGNQIVGPGNFSTPVTLADSDTSGTTTISPTTVGAPGTSASLSYTGNSLVGATITPSIDGTAGTAATFAPSGYAFVDYTTPSSLGTLGVLVPGPDGNVWFSTLFQNCLCGCTYTGYLAKITASGAVTTYTNNLPDDPIYGMAAGSDGNIWFGDYNNGNIGSINPSSGTVSLATSYTTPCGSALCGGVEWMVAGPDGNIWFSDYASGQNSSIGRISLPAGTVQEWAMNAIPGWNSGSFTPSTPFQIVFGNDGKIYVADGNDAIDQITLSGDAPASVVQLAAENACGNGVYSIANGTDGNLWFGDGCSNVGRVPTGANFTSANMMMWGAYGITNGSGFENFTSSPSGVWATTETQLSNSVFQIQTSAAVSASQGPPIVVVPAAGSNAQNEFYAIALGPDGNIWTGSELYSGSTSGPSPIIAKVFFGASSVNALGVARASSVLSHTARPMTGPFAQRFHPAKRSNT